MAEFAYEPEPEVALAPGERAEDIAGKSPWRLGLRRLARNRVAMGGLVLLIVLAMLLPIFQLNELVR